MTSLSARTARPARRDAGWMRRGRRSLIRRDIFSILLVVATMIVCVWIAMPDMSATTPGAFSNSGNAPASAPSG